MFGGWHEWLTSFFAILCVGAAIKIMDDFLDSEYDLCRGKITLAGRLGRAVLPYTLCVALLGAYLNTQLCISLFLASYALGMFSTWRDVLPTRLPAYVEILIAIGLSVLCTGWYMTLWAVSITAVIDWLDDLVDIAGDKRSGQRNLALRLGVVETILLLLAALCTAVLTNVSNTILVFVSLTALMILSEISTRNLWKSAEDGEEV